MLKDQIPEKVFNKLFPSNQFSEYNGNIVLRKESKLDFSKIWYLHEIKSHAFYNYYLSKLILQAIFSKF